MQQPELGKYVTSLMGRNPGEWDPKSKREVTLTRCATDSYARNKLLSPPTDVTKSESRTCLSSLKPTIGLPSPLNAPAELDAATFPVLDSIVSVDVRRLFPVRQLLPCFLSSGSWGSSGVGG